MLIIVTQCFEIRLYECHINDVDLSKLKQLTDQILAIWCVMSFIALLELWAHGPGSGGSAVASWDMCKQLSNEDCVVDEVYI